MMEVKARLDADLLINIQTTFEIPDVRVHWVHEEFAIPRLDSVKVQHIEPQIGNKNPNQIQNYK